MIARTFCPQQSQVKGHRFFVKEDSLITPPIETDDKTYLAFNIRKSHEKVGLNVSTFLTANSSSSSYLPITKDLIGQLAWYISLPAEPRGDFWDTSAFLE